jgi:hypothetical protein
VTGKYSEVHARRIQEPHKVFRDKKTHLLTLVLTAATNQFAIFLDEVEVLAGDLGAADRFEPALLPPAVIDDPNDFKPEDWVDAEFMVCASAAAFAATPACTHTHTRSAAHQSVTRTPSAISPRALLFNGHARPTHFSLSPYAR